MRVLRDTNVDPKGGWWFLVQQTDFVMKGFTYADLLGKIHEHLKVNELDVPVDLGLNVQSQIALRIPDRSTKEI